MDWIIPVLIVVGILVLWFATTYNGLQRTNIKIDEAESGIDVALTKRFDVLTKMIEVVKGYAKHEKETLEKVVSMRTPNKGASLKEKQEMVSQMNEAMHAINVVVEQYPDLKANENFKHLQFAINDVEEHLQAARRVYNANVSVFNQRCRVFPSNIVAGMLHFSERDFFEAEERKKEDVEIKF
ncbi:LemA family protein [Haloplasma contractile]|uniref:LemA family protein n=1 Tax=Haloplasma contractile SSD-17B TaxID=1033810 RepID=U2FHN8_9MOLU|nr:LemA family protein [Haloplasma contractile]ERJ12345.1 LemA family protein [Haloplasma contractile SSD-17B]